MILDWPDCVNARDLVGIPIHGGHRVRSGALLRSDNLDRLTPAGVALVRGAGIARVLDLRWNWEARRYPGPLSGDECYLNQPLLADEPAETGTTTGAAPTAGDEDPGYRRLLDDNRETVAAAFVALAEAPPGAVLVHCHAGRDRTGILVALALAAAGAAAGTIADDYARTEGCDSATMLDALGHIDDHHGGVTAYLTAGGAEPRHVAAVRERLAD